MSTAAAPLVAIVLGSKSDEAIAKKITPLLENFEVKFETKVISAHRLPDVLEKYASSLHRRGVKVVITIAGLSAALPGVMAAHTLLPVIGVPVSAGPLKGQDSLLSIVQMPKSVPVACVGIDNGVNAALLAIRIIAAFDTDMRGKLCSWKGAMQRACKEEIDCLNPFSI